MLYCTCKHTMGVHEPVFTSKVGEIVLDGFKCKECDCNKWPSKIIEENHQ